MSWVKKVETTIRRDYRLPLRVDRVRPRSYERRRDDLVFRVDDVSRHVQYLLLAKNKNLASGLI